MKAEIITIGDEILLGLTLNTNSLFISRRLDQIGIEVAYQTSVGDDIKTIEQAFKIALGRAKVIIVTGGLGPTNDDVTKKGIVKVFKKNLVFHEDILKGIEERFKQRGLKMPKINQNQALLPQGAKPLTNKFGSAPGILIEENGIFFFALPGVPLEMKSILEEGVIPILKENFPLPFIYHRKIRTSGIPESAIYEEIKELVQEKSNIKIAFLPGYLGVDIRLSLSGTDREKVPRKVAELEKKIVELLDEVVYGYDEETLEEVVGRMLLEKRKTISVAESCTGGLIAKKFTNVSGSSHWFERGVVSYSNRAKMEILKVPKELIEKFGAVSEETAILMAEGIRNLSKTDFGLSATGIAGPTGGTEEKPVGLVYIGLAHPDGSFAQKFLFGGDRDTNRQRSAQAALNLVRLFILGKL